MASATAPSAGTGGGKFKSPKAELLHWAQSEVNG